MNEMNALSEYKIITNKAQCLVCDEILESKHRHDFQRCLCGNLSVDGGKDYVKRSAKDFNKIIELSKYEEVK